MGNDLTPVNAARISRDNTSDDLSEKDIKLLKFLSSNGHFTPFEHATLTVIVECPLFIRSQIHRHRTFSYNEVSRRYTDENIQFYIPDELHIQDNINKQSSVQKMRKSNANVSRMRILCNVMQNEYEELIKAGVSREEARMILPQNLMTKFYMTGNIRNWSHFLKLRLDEHAQREVRIVAKKVLGIIKQYFPETIKVLIQD
jgi:thymidylate synthase (FAD)